MHFIETVSGRCGISGAGGGLKPNAKGSLTLHIEHARPEDAANRLAAPAGSFNLTMRL